MLTYLPNKNANAHSPWPATIVVIVAALTMARLCACDFTWWDDSYNIHQNAMFNPPSLASIGHYWMHAAFGLYIPITYTIWQGLAFIAYLKQPDANHIALNPWVFHSANVIVHLITAWIVFRILRELIGRSWPACFGALLFAVHPVQVESVGWVSGMKDLLAGCFGLLVIWRYIHRAKRDDEGYIDAWMIALLVLAVLSKPSAAMIPLLAIAIDKLLIGRSWRAIIRSVWPLLIVMIAALVGARINQNVNGIPAAPLWGRPLIVGDTLTFYLRQLIYPVPLGVDYGRRPAVVLSRGLTFIVWIIPLLLAAMLWYSRRRRPWLLAGGLLFALAILPVSGLSTFQFQFTSTTADHYLYTAMLGPAVIGAYFIDRYRRRAQPRVLVASCSVVILLLSARSIMQTFTWENDIALFSNALEVNPDSFLSHSNLGYAYKLLGNHDDAIDEFKAAISIDDNVAQSHALLAAELADRGDTPGAIEHLARAVQLRAQWPIENNTTAAMDHAALAELLIHEHRIDEARRVLDEGEAMVPGAKELEQAKELLRNATTSTAPAN